MASVLQNGLCRLLGQRASLVPIPVARCEALAIILAALRTSWGRCRGQGGAAEGGRWLRPFCLGFTGQPEQWQVIGDLPLNAVSTITLVRRARAGACLIPGSCRIGSSRRSIYRSADHLAPESPFPQRSSSR
jgi:hypothetical protein